MMANTVVGLRAQILKTKCLHSRDSLANITRKQVQKQNNSKVMS